MTNLKAFFRGIEEMLPGKVSVLGNKRYAAATAIWAKPTGALPRAIIHCQTARDVQTSVGLVRDHDLSLSVRGGGHDWAGRALGGDVAIDLRAMKNVTILSPSEIEICGGARVFDVAAVAESVGAAVVTGSVGMVGMTGLTLGGGYGSLIGRFGLAVDNLLSADIVLADGRLVRADAGNEEELFWALRGGGGNFGVVTSMRHRLHDLPSVHAGILFYPFDQARSVLGRCIEVSNSMPDEMTVQVGLGCLPDGTRLVFVVPTWCGEAAEGEKRMTAFSGLGVPLSGTLEVMSCTRLLSLFDPFISNGLNVHLETCWLPALDDGSVDRFIHAMENAVSPGCALITHEFKGAASRVPEDATAFALRRDHVLVEFIASSDPSDPLAAKQHREWARTAREAHDATAIPGGYANFLGRMDTERAVKGYGRNAPRLAAAKRRYDPENVFSSAIPLPAEQPDAVNA
jgi:FAD/FMN-containing dehydrogenase